ncbi:hypothetical protein VHEMI01309 [[Torrubiella] hemipterigena]|uniref:Uncharacterized protein n=1 Tax=[Torrubiella] hemipterigena TaxID=1531966 RepID=A0A0A1T540_9HYPO|nr:hypothetical protein VHEMI01309 [[Torrubiella] hemipterigena]
MSLLDINDCDGDDFHPSSFNIDIVFVHGLREAGLDAWKDVHTGSLWMTSIFPHARHKARTLVYEYDVNRMVTPGGPAATGIYDEAVSLANVLVANRELQNAERRPIIFFCHELGGLIVKRALAFSHSRKHAKLTHIRSIYRSTVAVMFMATPHQGLRKDAIIRWNHDKKRDPSQFELSLLEGSDTIQEVTDHFTPIMKDFQLYNFWEQKKTDFEQTSAYIVERNSAAPSWPDVDQCGINATHSAMVKFSSTKSPGYTLVLGSIEKYIRSAPQTVRIRWEQDSALLNSERAFDIGGLLEASVAGKTLITAAEPDRWKSEPNISTIPNNTSTSENVYYHVGLHSDYFVGRESQAELLLHAFKPTEDTGSEKPKVFVVYGLPGSGKTQFSLRYLEDHQRHYWGVFWIDCSTKETAESGFGRLGQLAGKGNERGAGIAWLAQTYKPWFVVLDNANDPQMTLSEFIPSTGNGNILITTRNPGARLYNTVGYLEFRGLNPEDAITLLLRLAYPDKELQDTKQLYSIGAKSIVSELGYLALAVKHAAFTIRSRMRPLEFYLKSLLTCRTTLLSRPIVESAADANIIATWELPFGEISSHRSTDYRDAVDLIHIFAFLHFATIPCAILSLCSDGIKSSTGLAACPSFLIDPVAKYQVEERILVAARVLYNHSIISIHDVDAGTCNTALLSGKYFTLHPAIHEWARGRLRKCDQLKWLCCTAAILEHAISSNMEPSGRMFRRLLLPHIESCRSLLKSAYPNLPETAEQASQLEKFGLVYSEAGHWETARILQKQVLAYRLRTLKQYHPLTIQAGRNLAHTYWNLFEIEHCLNLLNDIRKSQVIYRPSFFDYFVWPPLKPCYFEYYLTLDDLHKSLWLSGERDLSLTVGLRATNGLKELLGPEDPVTVNAMFNLARTFLHLGRYEESFELLEHVIKVRKRFWGPEHPDTLMARNELGMNLYAQGKDLLKAEQLVHSVLQSRNRILGAEHAYTLWSVNDLSKIWTQLERYDGAIQILEEILPIVARTLGQHHIGMVMTRSNLSRAYIRSGRLEKAKKEIIYIREQVPQNHPDSIYADYGWAYLLFHHDKNPELAVKCCYEALDRGLESLLLRPEHGTIASLTTLLLQIYEFQGHEDANESLRLKFPQLKGSRDPESIDFNLLQPPRSTNPPAAVEQESLPPVNHQPLQEEQPRLNRAPRTW